MGLPAVVVLGETKKDRHLAVFFDFRVPRNEDIGAGEAIRTPDPNLGKVMLYP